MRRFLSPVYSVRLIRSNSIVYASLPRLYSNKSFNLKSVKEIKDEDDKNYSVPSDTNTNYPLFKITDTTSHAQGHKDDHGHKVEHKHDHGHKVEHKHDHGHKVEHKHDKVEHKDDHEDEAKPKIALWRCPLFRPFVSKRAKARLVDDHADKAIKTKPVILHCPVVGTVNTSTITVNTSTKPKVSHCPVVGTVNTSTITVNTSTKPKVSRCPVVNIFSPSPANAGHEDDHEHKDDHGYHGHADHNFEPLHYTYEDVKQHQEKARELYKKQGIEIGYSTPWEKNDYKPYLNFNLTPYRLERWVDVDALFTEEYWADQRNFDEWDYIWKLKVDAICDTLKIPRDVTTRKAFRAAYNISQGVQTLENCLKMPIEGHTFNELPAFGFNNEQQTV